MNKEEYRKHCEEQIERCIKLHDSKHLKEHELSLALLNECEDRKRREEDLVKYLENKIKYFQDKIDRLDIKNIYAHFDIAEMYRNKMKIYQDILERVKSGKYE